MCETRLKSIIGISLLCLFIVAGCEPAAPVNLPPNTVQIVSFAFSPSTMTVAENTTVHWTNFDGVNHNVTSTPAGPLASGTIGPGITADFTFDTAGVYDYLCTIHPGMTGSITVTP